EAIDKGLDGAHFFGYSLGHYYVYGQHKPGKTVIWDEFQERRDKMGFAKGIVRADGAPLGAQIMEKGLGALRGAVGTPAQVREFLKGYEDVGVDEVILVSQAGRNRHEDICESLELFAKEILPEFQEREDKQRAEKARRMEPVIEKCMSRREKMNPRPKVDTIVTAGARF
ncbi:MAG: hypothetical protein ACRD1Z_13010, partial [Vicinamibacteria bacterium]